MSERRFRNVVGPACAKIRKRAGLTQAQLAAQCSVSGFHLSRQSLARIECQHREVTDYELMILARILKVPLQELFPNTPPKWAKHRISGHWKD